MVTTEEIEIAKRFIEYRDAQKKENRGGKIMYDVKGSHLYLSEADLFNHFISKFNP